MKPGDYILMTKQAGLEGTGIIAGDFKDELAGFLTDDEFREAAAMLQKVSVVKEGVIAGKIGTAGMHDITEGGVLGAVWEMCDIAKTGAEVWIDQIPVAGVTKKICDRFDIDLFEAYIQREHDDHGTSRSEGAVGTGTEGGGDPRCPASEGSVKKKKGSAWSSETKKS